MRSDSNRLEFSLGHCPSLFCNGERYVATSPRHPPLSNSNRDLPGTAKTPKGRPKATGKSSRSIDSYFRPPLAPLPAAINQNARRHQPQGREVVADACERSSKALAQKQSPRSPAQSRRVPPILTDASISAILPIDPTQLLRLSISRPLRHPLSPSHPMYSHLPSLVGYFAL